jgi:uncharacterized protein (TIGR02246 family)
MTSAEADEAAIRRLFDISAEAWAKGDAELFASVFAEDAIFINIVAHRLQGREEIARHHAQLWANVYSGAKVETDSVLVSLVRPDVATVEVKSTLRMGDIERHADQLALALRNGDTWELQAVHNMVPFTPPKG